MSDECLLKGDGSGSYENQCCCACAHLLMDHHHHDGDLHKKGLCFKAKGWICNNPEVGTFSGWPLHSCGCEMFQSIGLDARKARLALFGERSVPTARDQGTPGDSLPIAEEVEP